VFECVVVISEGSKVIVGDVGVVVDVFFFFWLVVVQKTANDVVQIK